MAHPKRLIEMAKKWQRFASLRRRRIAGASLHDDISIADKGHFVVYSMDGKRFMLPLEYLESQIFGQLFKMSEEEFGLPSDGPITLPCDAALLKYIMSLLRR